MPQNIMCPAHEYQLWFNWFKFYFPLFLGMVMYDEFKTKGK